MYDAIVVGARCAGSATALLLAGAGHRVLLVDRAGFPSETMSTRYIHQPGVARLAEWGVLDGVLASGCPAVRHLTHTVEGVTVGGRLPACRGVDFAVAPSRTVLDDLLLTEAQAMGAEFRPRTAVTDLLWDDGRVVGVALRGRPERAHVVIGADGMRSTVARLCGAATAVDDGRRTFVHYALWRLPAEAARIVESRRRYLSVIPTHGAAVVATYAPQDEFAVARVDAMAFHRAVIAELAPELGLAEQAGRLVGTGDQRNFLRQAAGPGWALVGDAGHHKDSITARGIGDAFLQAELLAEVLAGRFRTKTSVDAALAEFARRRDPLLADSYASTLSAAALTSTPHRLEVLADIARSPERTGLYLGVMAGMCRTDVLMTG